MSQGLLTVTFWLRGVFFIPQNTVYGREIVNLGGHQFELALLQDFLSTKRALEETDWNAITASLTAREVHEDQIPSIEDTVERICWLLSFAGGALVAFCEREIEGGPAKLPVKHSRAITKTKKPFTPPLELSEPGTVRHWLQASYESFVVHEERYLLNNVIHMLCLADAEHNMTVQALLVASTLEILRYNFAQNVLLPSNRAIFDKDSFYTPGKKQRLSY
jgi:hypothetical protein